MKLKITIFLFAGVFSLPVVSSYGGSRTIELSSYGVKPWSFENASPAIRKAIGDHKGESDLVFRLPPGRIDMWPEGAVRKELVIMQSSQDDSLPKMKNIAFFFEDLENVTLEGDNTIIMLHGKMMIFVVERCRNFRIRNLSVDFEHPMMAEMTITKRTGSIVEVELTQGARSEVADGRVMLYGEGWKFRDKMYHAILFKRDSEHMKYFSWEQLVKGGVDKTGPGRLAFHGNFKGEDPAEGDIITVRDHYREYAGAFFSFCRNLAVENVNIHFMPGMGFMSEFSEDISFRKVSVAPSKETGRIVAAWADCFHFTFCKGHIAIDSCFTSGGHDDPVNVHGIYLKVTGINGNRITARYMHNQAWGSVPFFRGDSVFFVSSANLLPKASGVVNGAGIIDNRNVYLDMKSIPGNIKQGDCIENITWTPSLKVSNCRFERVNTRGILVTTRKPVIIENNIFHKLGMHAILIADDCNFWYSSGPCHNVIIRNNLFIQCGYNQDDQGYVISVSSETGTFVKGRYIHSGITITGNEFRIINDKLVFARSVNGLNLTDNRSSFETFYKRVVPVIKTEHCRNVVIKGNNPRIINH